jgi:hypothetical protein
MLMEKIVNPTAALTHGPAIDAMNAGASAEQIAGMYRQPSGDSSAGSGDTHHYHISAMDADSFDRFLRKGGARTVARRLNGRASQYAGDGIG